MQFLQPTVKLAVKTFLDENPELTQKYVDTSITAISYLLGPLNVFMRHLLVVQGLDPDTQPGVKAAKELQAAMNAAFEPHMQDYDADYDFSWVSKRFEESRKHLKDLQLTKEKFMDLTDISKLVDGREPTMATVVVAPNTDPYEVGTSFLSTSKEVNDIAAEGVKREIRMHADGDTITTTSDPLNTLRLALESIEKELDIKPEKPKKTHKPSKSKSKNKKTPSKKIKKIGDHYALVDKEEKKNDLVKQMVNKGLCDASSEAVLAQLKEMEKWSDDSLESLERVVNRRTPATRLSDEKVETKFKGNFRRSPSKA